MKKIAIPYAVSGILALASLISDPAFASPTPSAIPPVDCHSAFDPYSYTSSALAACGITTLRASVRDLPGGGKQYTYGDSVAWTTVPPAGFDPATASASALAEYGYPPRPTSPQLDATWLQMARIPRSEPEPFIVQRPDYSATVSSSNWSGYAARNGGLTYVQAEYTEPTILGCSGASEVTWTGLGGYPRGVGGALAQNGTGHNDGLASHQPWWEVATSTSGSITSFPQGGAAHAGDTMLAIVDTQSLPGDAEFSVYDYATGASWQTTVSLHGLSASSSAETIVERPALNGSLTALSDFGTWNVTSTSAAQNGLAQPLEYFSPDALDMYNGSTQLAHAGSLSTGFSDSWKHCS